MARWIYRKELRYEGILVTYFFSSGTESSFYFLQSDFGAFLDPLADKIFIGSVALGLTWTGLLPGAVTFVIIGRDILLIMGSFILRAREKTASSAFFDIRTSTFQIIPSDLSKVNILFTFLIYADLFLYCC